MRKFLWLSLAAGVALIVFGPMAGAETIIVGGTGDSESLVADIAAEFMLENPQDKIEVPVSVGSDGAVKGVVTGDFTLGRMARGIKESEKLYEFKYIEFAKSPVVFIVNPLVNVERLTVEQICDIYSGRITRWEDVLAHKAKIYALRREYSDSSFRILNDKLTGFSAIVMPDDLRIINKTAVMIHEVEVNPDAIGFAPLSAVFGHKVKVIKIDSPDSGLGTFLAEDYKLVIPFGFIYKGELTGLSKRFIEFIFSDKGKRIMKKYGCIPLTKQ